MVRLESLDTSISTIAVASLFIFTSSITQPAALSTRLTIHSCLFNDSYTVLVFAKTRVIM